MASDEGVLIIHTGGTIGSLPEDPEDPSSPLVPAPLETIIHRLPNYKSDEQEIFIGKNWIRIDTYSWEIPLDSSNITLGD